MPPIAELAPLTADQVSAEHDRLGGLLCLLPELNLSAEQKMALAGYLFKEGPSLVLSVAYALKNGADDGGQIFTAGPAVAEDLHARLRRSFALRTLERLLLEGARRAGELALIDQAGAVRDSMEVVRKARLEDEAGVPGARQKIDRLRPALQILKKRQERPAAGVRRAHEARRRAAAPEAQAPPVQERSDPGARVEEVQSMGKIGAHGTQKSVGAGGPDQVHDHHQIDSRMGVPGWRRTVIRQE